MIYIVFENTVYLNVNADADAEISKALFYLFLMTFFSSCKQSGGKRASLLKVELQPVHSKLPA